MVVRHFKTTGHNLADTVGRYMALLPAANIPKKEVSNSSTLLHTTVTWKVLERILAKETLCFKSSW